MAFSVSSYQSELFYCRCPEGTNHLAVDENEEGDIWRNDMNTLWHVLTEAPQSEPKLSIKKITRVTRPLPQAITEAIKTRYGEAPESDFVGRVVVVANSARLSLNEMNQVLNRSYANDDQMPVYEGSFPFVVARVDKEQDHRLFFHRISDEKTEAEIEDAIQVDQLRQQGLFEAAEELLSTSQQLLLLEEEVANLRTKKSSESKGF